MRSLAADLLARAFAAAGPAARKLAKATSDIKPRPANEHIVKVEGLRRVNLGWAVRVRCARGTKQIGVFPDFVEAIAALRDYHARCTGTLGGYLGLRHKAHNNPMYGVHFHAKKGTYRARPRYRRQPKDLGSFTTAERASVAVRLFLLWVERGYTDIPAAPYGNY